MSLTKDQSRLNRDQVKHVAKLANLSLASDEEEKYTEQLSKILGYVEQLNRVDISEVGPTSNVSGQENVMTDDKTGSCTLSQEETLSNTAKKQDGLFVTKGIFDE